MRERTSGLRWQCDHARRASRLEPLAFEEDQDFPLKGGSAGYVRGRNTAVRVNGRRLCAIALFVFRTDEFPWPAWALLRRAARCCTHTPRYRRPAVLDRALCYAAV
jgi:hypothetical protein